MEWNDVNLALPESQSIYDSPNKYYLVWIQGFGYFRAMYMKDNEGLCAWYTSYTSKVFVPVTHWMNVLEPTI